MTSFKILYYTMMASKTVHSATFNFLVTFLPVFWNDGQILADSASSSRCIYWFVIEARNLVIKKRAFASRNRDTRAFSSRRERAYIPPRKCYCKVQMERPKRRKYEKLFHRMTDLFFQLVDDGPDRSIARLHLMDLLENLRDLKASRKCTGPSNCSARYQYCFLRDHLGMNPHPAALLCFE